MANKAFGRVIFAIPVAGTFALGTWQAKRWQWKKDLIEERVSGLQQSAIDAPVLNSETDWSQLHFKKIRVKGQFLSNRTFFIGPRAAPTTQASGSGLMSSPNPQTGYFLLTPFLPADPKFDPFLVNRGWIPASLRNDAAEKPDSPQMISIVCVPRPGEPKSMFITNDAASGSLISMDVSAMAEQAHLQMPPVVCDLLEVSGEGAAPGGYPVRKRPENLVHFHVMPYTHAAYAATWYSLSAAFALLTYHRFR